MSGAGPVPPAAAAVIRNLQALLLFGGALFYGSLRAQEPAAIRGAVTDSATHEPLAAANVRVLGSSRGTVANGQGRYVLTLPRGTYSIVYSSVGYLPETLAVALDRPQVRDAALVPSPVQMPGVVVTAEDPALEIIRKAIARKRLWMDKITSYRFEAFTRQVLRRDSSIAGVMEAFSTGYWRQGDTLREIVTHKRQTQNVASDENLAAVRRIVNFNDDEISLFSIRADGMRSAYLFTGPTAPDALDNYDYHLEGIAALNGVEIYRIAMTPKSRLRPLFNGTITIADGSFAVIGVDVVPNEAFTIPFLKEIRLRYRQQFTRYEGEFWMPADIRIDGGFNISFVGISLPRIGISVVSSIYDYAINPLLPDSLFRNKPLTVDSTAAAYDSTYWKANDVLPLTGEEERAYATLDSTQTLRKQFEPKGPLAAMSGEGGGLLDYADIRFNRAEGFFFGAHASIDSLARLLRVDGAAGAAVDAQRFEYDAGATFFTGSARRYGAGVRWYAKGAHFPDRDFYGPFVTSLMALIDKDDYRDYYFAQGISLTATAQPGRRLRAEATFRSEREYALPVATNYSLFSRSTPYRPNPAAREGLLRSVRLDLRIGDEPVPLGIVSRRGLELSAEYSSPSFMKSEFDFARYEGELLWSFHTFGRSLLFPASLRFSLAAGAGVRDLPPQRMFRLDTRASGYAPFGVLKGGAVAEFSGERFVALAVEHNFRSLPFLLLDLPLLYRNSIELVVHGAVAQVWPAAVDGWYREAGIGVSRIFDLLRADVTWRFTEPRRFTFSLSIATIF